MSARISRRQVLAAIALQADLPTPSSIAFADHRIDIDLDSVADLHAWLSYFGMDAKSVRAQPYTHKLEPLVGQVTTLANAFTCMGEEWRGWHVHLSATDPVGEPEPALDDATREQLRVIADETPADSRPRGAADRPAAAGNGDADPAQVTPGAGSADLDAQPDGDQS